MSAGEFNNLITLFSGLSLLIGGMLCLFRKDIVWRFYSWNMRSRGIKNIERTSEWDLRFTIIGITVSIVGVISILYVVFS
jgi:hypothetical protein